MREHGTGERESPLVLHVTEALGGGVITALREIATAAPTCRHQLLAAVRQQHATGASLEEAFERVSVVGSGPLAMARRLRRAVRAHDPDVIHLHSSWAGLIGRVVLGPWARRLVYTPHCFDFERTDRSTALRFAVRTVERLLSRRCQVVAGCSPRETALATALGGRAVHVPNVITGMPEAVVADGSQQAARPVIVSIGRLSRQKDPRFFASTVDAAVELGVDAEWIWVGDGDEADRERLCASGVEVTGWLTQQQSLRQLASASLYVHTAAWEGSPMTVLEAEALGVRVAVRSIPATVALGYPEGIDTPADMARHILAVLSGERVPPRRFPLPSKAAQREALEGVYSSVCEQAGRRPRARAC